MEKETQAKKGKAMKKPRRWREVTIEELRRVWAYLSEQDSLPYNGCTNAELIRRYGVENIKHRMGVGWFKLTSH